MDNELSEILEALSKPLRFASKDGFVHLGSLRSVEPLAAALLNKAVSLKPSPEVLSRIEALKGLFTGFDALALSSKRERVERAFEAIESISPSSPQKPVIDAAEAERRLALLKPPLTFIKGIGPKLAERLEKKGLSTVEDILYFLPIRYEDRSRIKRIRELTPGVSEAITGEVLAIGEARKAVSGVPAGVAERHGLIDLASAMREAHAPSSPQSSAVAKKSLAFDELFLLETGFALRRASLKKESGS